MERVAAGLLALDPAAERFDGEGFIEISTDSMQVSVYAREAAITIPYWFSGDEAEPVLERAFAYARVLHDTGGFAVADPQTGEIVDFDDLDVDRVAALYARGVDVADRITEQPERPWWKLWGS